MKQDILWESVDRINPDYFVKVVRTSPYTGDLIVYHKKQSFHVQKVHVRYDAKFGADYGDIAEWSEIAEEVVKKHEGEFK